VPAASLDLILSFRHSRGVSVNSQKLITVRSFTEIYRQSYSIRTARDWNAIPHSVMTAGNFFSTVQEQTDPSHLAVGVMPLSTNYPAQDVRDE